MAYYAELKRRHWSRINGMNMIKYYKAVLRGLSGNKKSKHKRRDSNSVDCLSLLYSAYEKRRNEDIVTPASNKPLNKAKLNVDRIMGNPYYRHLDAEYRAFVESNKNTVFTVRNFRSDFYELKGMSRWLFMKDDLIFQ